MTHALWNDLVTALQNYVTAREDGSINHRIVRELVDAINAAR